MTLKEKLTQFQTALASLKVKLNNFKSQKEQALNQQTTKANEAQHKLELSLKEQKENETLLEQLLKEMGELEESLN
jgi:hypothetical protein